MVKKVLLGLVLFIVGTISLIAILPSIISIDKYRPEIVSLIQENINGKVSIGELSLSLFGRVSVGIEDLSIDDAAGKRVLEVGNTSLNFPFMSLISGTPSLTVKLNSPAIKIIKSESGDINLLGLVKESPTSPANDKPSQLDPKKPVSEAEIKDKEEGELASIILESQADIMIENADIRFLDAGSKIDQSIKNFNILLKNISLSQEMGIEIWADVKTKIDKISVQGPLSINGFVKPTVVDNKVKSFKLQLKSNLTEMAAEIPDVFNKSDDLPMGFEIDLQASQEGLNIDKMSLKLNDLDMVITGKVGLKPDLSYEFKINQEGMNLEKWNEVVLPLKSILKENLKIKWSAHIQTDKLTAFNLNAEGIENDLTLQASIIGFQQPAIDIKINSNSLNLDRLLVFLNQESGSTSKGATPSKNKEPSSPASGNEEVVDVDAQLKVLQENDFIKNTKAKVIVRLKKIKVMKVDVSDFNINMAFKKLIGSIDQLKLGVFGGQVDVNSQLNLATERPTYSSETNVIKIDFKKAVESQFPSFANTVMGILSFKGKGYGKSLNSDLLLKNLVFNGNFDVTDATFATVDIVKMVNEGGATVSKMVKEKWAGAPTDKIKSMKEDDGKYRLISSDFTLKDGQFHAPNFQALSEKNKGVDIRGDTQLDLINDKLNAKWDIVDTYNKTGLKDLSISERGVTVNQVLAERGKPVRFPMVIGCKLSEPCYKYGQIAAHFGKVAGDNIKAVVGKKLKSEVKKIQKKEGEKLKNQLKDKAKELLKGKKFPF